MTYAFTFDAAFCSGCKACQAACKDKNNLPVGVLWRRVIEVSGGTWQQSGAAWHNTVFAYNLSLACNHCMHPKCAGVCPTRAYTVREDGIVFLDTSRCMGCGYCAWACPYGVPQYNPDAGVMSKCNLCCDNLAQGLPPACVAACPLRVLEYKEVSGSSPVTNEIRLWEAPPDTHPYPLPNYSHSEPRLAIKVHAAMKTVESKSVANLEEIQPRKPSEWEELPLILFTLFIQMAVGSFWAWSWMGASSAQWIALAVIGLSLGTGMLVSLIHLGNKKNAWRALTNLRRSRMSREILFVVLFGTGWLLTTLATMMQSSIQFASIALTSILGIGLIHNMAEVYRFPAAPGWNTWRTNAGFFVSALLLGTVVMAAVLADAPHMTMTGSLILVLLVAQIVLMRKPVRSAWEKIRLGLILVGILLGLASILQFVPVVAFSPFLTLVVLIEEILGRWLFYRSRTLLPTIK